jgi:hypothetical protein
LFLPLSLLFHPKRSEGPASRDASIRKTEGAPS